MTDRSLVDRSINTIRLLAQRLNGPGHDIVSHRIVALCSGGDLMEGIGSGAASAVGWERRVGMTGSSFGIDRCNASAPGSRALAELGIHRDNVVPRAKAVLARIAACAEARKEGRAA